MESHPKAHKVPCNLEEAMATPLFSHSVVEFLRSTVSSFGRQQTETLSWQSGAVLRV